MLSSFKYSIYSADDFSPKLAGGVWGQSLYRSPKPVARGTSLFDTQGGAPRICFIAEGWVALHKSLADGNRQILGFRCAGEHFCAFTDVELRTAIAAECLTACRIGWASARALEESDDPEAKRLALAVMQAELSAAYEGLANLGGRAVRERVAFLLVDLARRAGAGARPGPTHLPISQQLLAEALGVTNVHLNRVLKDFRAHGIVECRRDGVHVLDLAALTRAARL